MALCKLVPQPEHAHVSLDEIRAGSWEDAATVTHPEEGFGRSRD